MEWNHPEALWLILPLTGLWLAVALYDRSRKQRAAAAFVAAALWPRIMPPDSSGRFWLKTALRTLALILGMAALAGPRFGKHYEEVRPRGSDLYVLIDVSRSMLAEDVPPSRLGRAKADVAELLQHLNGERIALIAFAGKAVVVCPLTTDYNYFRTALNELSPASAPRGGTAIGDAIRKALEVLPQDAERDQTLLLITDGDDQESMPLKAAEAAAERRVAIFTVGLGDAEKGSRVPSEKGGAAGFMEYKGEQVWSKLNGDLLSEIALKTKGVYIPAGTRAYDLGTLYQDHLKGRQSANAKEKRQVRLSEQYQLFLALALFCLLLELLIRPYRSASDTPGEAPALPGEPVRSRQPLLGASAAALALLASGALLSGAGVSRAADEPGPEAQGKKANESGAGGSPAIAPRKAVGEGLALYAKDEFESARERFGQAAEQFRKSQDNTGAAIASFDAGCAAQRKGDTEKAREAYLEAGMARDPQLAARAHFNLGCLAAESARALAGEHPEELAPEKRQEVKEKLLDAATRFRCCLGIQPNHTGARKNLELAREWLKYYSDKWRELDRQRMRRETNLVQFLDYLITTERALREGVKALKPNSQLDDFAEGKRMQEELEEEIGPLKEKIQKDLAPPPQQPGAAPAGQQPQMDPKQMEEALKLLQGWADAAGDKMKEASERLAARQPTPAAEEQKGAITELEKIWDAVAPFPILLARDLADQTSIVHTLKPEIAEEEDKKDEPAQKKGEEKQPEKKAEDKSATKQPSPETRGEHAPEVKALADEESTELAEEQEHTARRTDLLKLKAEVELKRVEQMPLAQPPPTPPSQPPAPAGTQDNDKKLAQTPAPPDPEKIKEGLRKAVELAPKAVEKMNAAAAGLRNKRLDTTYPDAEEARKILEEIAKAQPKQENKEQKNDQEKKDQKKDEQKKDEQKKQDENKEQQKEEKQQMSADRIEAALRKVREREKQKHERDQQMKALMLKYDRSVEKDW